MAITVTSEPVKVTVTPSVAKVTVSGNPSKVTVAASGVPGPMGPQGPQGIPGASGSGFVHEQSVASASWSISHPLMRLPNVAIYIAGEEVEADVTSDDTTTNISFPYPVTGYAVLV